MPAVFRLSWIQNSNIFQNFEVFLREVFVRFRGDFCYIYSCVLVFLNEFT